MREGETGEVGTDGARIVEDEKVEGKRDVGLYYHGIGGLEAVVGVGAKGKARVDIRATHGWLQIEGDCGGRAGAGSDHVGAYVDTAVAA
jgi:hypothetical protein